MRRAFVIQLRQGAEPGVAEFAGRVEHVDSGRADHFVSVDELVRFMERTIAEVEAEEPKKPTL
jgi:hypothetical protein